MLNAINILQYADVPLKKNDIDEDEFSVLNTVQ